jgi:hypothetical protein
MTNPKLRYPAELTEALEVVLPAAQLEFQIEGQRFSLNQCWLYFREYTGPSPKKALDKPIVGPPNRPFAELQAVTRLEQQGWTGSWLSGPGEFTSTWEPPTDAQPSQTVRELVTRIDSRAAANASRWDVFAWKPELRFIQMMRAGSSEILSPSKLRWLEAAIAEGVPSSAFEIWRWFGGSLEGRLLRLTDYTLDRLDGWVECQNGHLTYSEPGIQGLVDFYRDLGARTEADLLWLVFVRNSQGMTWCGIEERDGENNLFPRILAATCQDARRDRLPRLGPPCGLTQPSTGRTSGRLW